MIRRRGFLGGLAAVFGAGALPTEARPVPPAPVAEPVPSYQEWPPPQVVEVDGGSRLLAGEELLAGDMVTIGADGRVYRCGPRGLPMGVVRKTSGGISDEGVFYTAKVARSGEIRDIRR